MGKYFTYGFLGVFFVILAIVLFAFKFVSGDGLEEGTGLFLWSILIIVFLLLGVIIISLFINKMREKTEGKE